MNKLRNLIAAAAALTLSFAALTPASAHFNIGRGGFGHFHGHFRFHEHWRFGFHEHWRSRFHEHWRYGWHHRLCFHWRYCGPHYGGNWRYHYHYGVGYSAPVVAEAPVCPVGFHLGYLGKHCWPNRR